jgi:hypothetical protein
MNIVDLDIRQRVSRWNQTDLEVLQNPENTLCKWFRDLGGVADR